MAEAVTQIIYLTIPADRDLSDASSKAGKAWSEALDLLQNHIGFKRLYWGRSPEDKTKVQLHVVRDQYSQHQDFLNSTRYAPFEAVLKELIDPSTKPFTRHAYMQEFTPNCQALAKGAPFTGSAIYVGTDAAWHEGAWPLWTHLVRYIDGCLGCAGGKLVEPVDGFENSYIVYVGWETIEKHEHVHTLKWFENRKVILALGNKGYREYGHVKFEGSREAGVAKL